MDKTVTRALFGTYEAIETESAGNYELRERYNSLGPVIITVEQADYQSPSEFYPIMDALGSMVAAHISYGSGASIDHALRGGARSAAIAHANATVAGYIGGLEGVGQYGKAAMHSARCDTFSAIQGGGFRSGAIGAGVEVLLAGYVGGIGKGNPAAEAAVATFISGTVSEATSGKFWVGAHEGAVGYLFNHLGGNAGAG